MGAFVGWFVPRSVADFLLDVTYEGFDDVRNRPSSLSDAEWVLQKLDDAFRQHTIGWNILETYAHRLTDAAVLAQFFKDGWIEYVRRAEERRDLVIPSSVIVKLFIVDPEIGGLGRRFIHGLHLTKRVRRSVPEFGFYHIGPWVVDWTNGSLCIPQEFDKIPEFGSSLLCAFDLFQVPNTPGSSLLETFFEDLSKVIVKWNLTKTFTWKEDNCDDFAMDVIHCTTCPPEKSQGFLSSPDGIPFGEAGFQFATEQSHEFQWSVDGFGVFHRFVQLLRWRGRRGGFEFVPSTAMMDDGHFSPDLRKPQTFSTHAELDAYVIRLDNAKGDFFAQYYLDEWTYLKSLDRAYWLRALALVHMKSEQNENRARGVEVPISAQDHDRLAPLYAVEDGKGMVCICPFLVPARNTNTMIGALENVERLDGWFRDRNYDRFAVCAKKLQ